MAPQPERGQAGDLNAVRWLAIPTHGDERGVLTAVEGDIDVPFPIARVYILHHISADRGGHAHRDTHQLVIAAAGCCDLVLADDSNPRSLAYQLRRLDDHLAALPKRPGELTVLPVSQIANDLSGVVRMFDRGDAIRQNEGVPLSMLRDLLEESAHGLRALSNAITRAYFTHVPAAQALGSQRAAQRV